MISISRVVKGRAHQHNILLVENDRCGDESFTDVLCFDYLLLPPFVQQNSNSMFDLKFSGFQEYVSFMSLPDFGFG